MANTISDKPQRFSPVVELRQYTLKPGARETLIDVFDNHLIEGQEELGMAVIGQFRDLDRPDMFVWLRGFADMERRRDGLHAFYNGPVWAEHSHAANATMIDSDDVLLLKPARSEGGFDLGDMVRPNSGGGASPASERVFVAQIIHLAAGDLDFATRFGTGLIDVMEALGAPPVAAFVSEHAENTFPRLPVRTGENVLVAFSAFDDREALALHERALAQSGAWAAWLESTESSRTKPIETLRLSPTSRSLLR